MNPLLPPQIETLISKTLTSHLKTLITKPCSMTILESITKSAAAADAGNLSPPHYNFPIISNADQILPNLQIAPQYETLIGSQTLIKPASDWRIPALDSDLNDLLTNLCLNLKTKLKSPRNFSKSEFISLVNLFFKKSSFMLQSPIESDPDPLDPLDLNFTLAAIQNLGVLISREVASLIAEGCVAFEVWCVLESIIEKKLVGNLNSFNLVEKLGEKNQTKLICLCATKISNLRDSEIYSMLKFFLSPSKDSYDGMVRVRKEWEKDALLAIEKVKMKGLPRKNLNLVKEASIMLMMAHDGFYSSEICLHYVFGSKNFDGILLSSAISRLDGFEALGLVRYFVKWLEKYERFPQARPCFLAGAVLGLSTCEIAPTLEDAVKGLKLVLDEHFSYLVLNTEFRDELRKVEKVVGLLVSDADLCCPVDDIVMHLKELRKKEGQ